MIILQGFPAPPNTDLIGYHTYIDEAIPPESPYLYGLHPNAEIGFLTMTAENLFRTVFEMQPRDTGGSGGQTVTREEKVTLCHIVQRRIEYHAPAYRHVLYLTGETGVRRDIRKTTRGVQYDGDHGEGRGTDALRNRRLPRMREDELPDDRDQAVVARAGSGSQGRTHHHVGHGGSGERVILGPSSARVG